LVCKNPIINSTPETRSIVPQDINRFFLLAGESVSLAKSFDEEMVKTILKKVSLQLDSSDSLGVEFGGKELSKGQWQRLSLARCIYSNGKLLVLDEATSAIDPLEEQKILDFFIDDSKGKMAFIVTHRLSICRRVDRIIYLEGGKIIANGNHKTLMNTCSKYRKLYEEQARMFI
jgi:ATP-binding cassette, subfamily B, bacterial